jgi:hypothetical protein
MTVTIGLISDQSARYSIFLQSLLGLIGQVPPGTTIDLEIGADHGRSRNTIVERALQGESQWLLFIDDDHTFSPDILATLLSRNVPVVGALYPQRTDPFLPIAYAERDQQGRYWPLDLAACPEHGLAQVAAVGMGCTLISMEVFRRIPAPWFKHTTDVSEDLFFCGLCADAGIPVHVDLDARLGHVAPISIYFDYEEGWFVGVAASSESRILLPINGDPGEEQQAPAPSLETAPGQNGAAPERVEMWADADGLWHARSVSATGQIVGEARVQRDEKSAEQAARSAYPGLPIFMVADESSDSTWTGMGPSPRRMFR